MPRFDLVLSAYAHDADQIVFAGESSRPRVSAWTTRRLESLYELAYLRVFAAWESILESIFLRSLCGFASRAGQEILVTGTYHRTIANAEIAVLSGQSYMLWHNPTKVVARCKKHIISGGAGPACQETVLSSNLSRTARFRGSPPPDCSRPIGCQEKFRCRNSFVSGEKIYRSPTWKISPRCGYIIVPTPKMA